MARLALSAFIVGGGTLASVCLVLAAAQAHAVTAWLSIGMVAVFALVVLGWLFREVWTAPL